MKSTFTNQSKKLDIKKNLYENQHILKYEEGFLLKTATKAQQILKAREYYAASRIQGIVRGYLDRLVCMKIRKYIRALKLIQRIMLGKLGRIRWKREYWRSLSVVKSDPALEEILERSTLLREDSVGINKHKQIWCEYYDPLSEAFWYYNKKTKQNTWIVPLCFQKTLICHWNGYYDSGGIPNQSPCRCVFDTIDSYRNHLRLGHVWYCIACHQRNPGLIFPKCSLCGNRYNKNGIDGEEAMINTMDNIKKKINIFISEEGIESSFSNNTMSYSLKTRLAGIAQDRRNALDISQQYRLEQEANEIWTKGNGLNTNKHELNNKLIDINDKYLGIIYMLKYNVLIKHTKLLYI